MTDVVIYTKDWCGYCSSAKQLLDKLGYRYQEIDVTDDIELYKEMRQRAGGRTTVPQIFMDGAGIGGYNELCTLFREKRLPPP
ncbi:MAG TPA: glutaredoxin 3 [Candidatus Acidoferrum sp.]|nr:glutaredoxin 3 [Candidatus Acidoferrum sp.]